MVPEGANLESRVRQLHELAEQVRIAAAAMYDPKYRLTTLLTAKSYERMANRLDFLTQHLSLSEEPGSRISPESIAEEK
jgi:hypothetical protein